MTVPFGPSAVPDHPFRACAATVMLLVLGLTTSCGLWSREQQLAADLHAAEALPTAERRARVAELCGRDPTSSFAWSYQVAEAANHDEQLALLDQAETFLPVDPNVHMNRAATLEQSADHAARVTALRASLEKDWSAPMEASFRTALVDALLDNGDVNGAQTQASLLAGLPTVPPPAIAQTHARVALELAFANRMEEADQWLDLALTQGPSGLGALRLITTRQPESRAAAHLLILRAAERHPDHADVLLYLVVDALEVGRLAEAEGALAVLPRPLPDRLEAGVDLLGAQIHLAAGRTAEGLAILLGRLDRNPAEPEALTMMVELHQRAGIPERGTLLHRLAAALAVTRNPASRQQLEQALAFFSQTEADGDPQPQTP